MTKDELIAKQQLEIEELKEYRREIVAFARTACNELIRCEQWSIKADEFPKVAMRGIVTARNILSEI